MTRVSYLFTMGFLAAASGGAVACGDDAGEPAALPGAGGAFGTGGGFSSGGAGNGAGGIVTGGASSGGAPGSGGATGATGGANTASGGAGSGGTAGAGGESGGTCDPSGTWAILFETKVKWPAVMLPGTTLTILEAGQGSQSLRLLSTRTYDATTRVVTDTSRVCGVTVPGFETVTGAIQLVFPPAGFDGSPVGATLVSTLAGAPGSGATFESGDGAILVGATMTNPATDPWPAPTAITPADADGDSAPGITAEESGRGVPTNALGPNADRLYLAFRSIASVAGTMDSCDRSHGTITLKSINQSILGCRIKGGTTQCDASQTEFINANGPVWSPDGTSEIKMQRVAAAETCAGIRTLAF
jgi:hypothetical protein